MTERRLLLPIRGADPERRPPPGLELGAVSGGPDDPITPVVERAAEEPRMLLFRGIDEIRRWRDPARFIAAPEEPLFDLARRLGVESIVLDVAGPVRQQLGTSTEGGALSPGPPFDLRGLAGPLTLHACGRVRTELARERSIEAAWVVEATVEGSDIIVVALEVGANGSRDELGKRLMRTIGSSLPLDSYAGIQIVVLEDPAVSDAVRHADAPIYRRH